MEEEEEVDLGFGPFGKKEDAAEMEKLKVGRGEGRTGLRRDIKRGGRGSCYDAKQKWVCY